MSRQKQQAGGPEYLLTVTSQYKEIEDEYRTVVILQTVREFASFRYELNVHEERHEQSITYRVTGLKAPQLSLPGNGPAFFTREYSTLRGPVKISVEGLDHKTNVFEFEVGEKAVRLTNAPQRPFVAVSTGPNHGTETP
jgi:hypothetical protein